MYASRKNQLVNEGAVPFPPKQKHWMEVDDEKTAYEIDVSDWSSDVCSSDLAVAQGTADDYRRAYALKEKFSADAAPNAFAKR